MLEGGCRQVDIGRQMQVGRCWQVDVYQINGKSYQIDGKLGRAASPGLVVKGGH